MSYIAFIYENTEEPGNHIRLLLLSLGRLSHSCQTVVVLSQKLLPVRCQRDAVPHSLSTTQSCTSTSQILHNSLITSLFMYKESPPNFRLWSHTTLTTQKPDDHRAYIRRIRVYNSPRYKQSVSQIPSSMGFNTQVEVHATHRIARDTHGYITVNYQVLWKPCCFYTQNLSNYLRDLQLQQNITDLYMQTTRPRHNSFLTSVLFSRVIYSSSCVSYQYSRLTRHLVNSI